MKTVAVTKSKNPQDYESGENPMPWEYSEEAFLGWVWEVFQECKDDAPELDLDEAIELAESFGYTIEVGDDE